MKDRLLAVVDLYGAMLTGEVDRPRSPCLRLNLVINPTEPGFDLLSHDPDDTKSFSFELTTIHESDGEVKFEHIDLQLTDIPVGHA